MFHCNYKNSRPEPFINWTFNGNHLETTNSKYFIEHNVLHVKKVLKQDSGVYACALSNGYHQSQSINFTLSVQGI